MEYPSASLESETASPTGFAAAPASWYYLGSVAELARGPLRFDLPAAETYVGYRTDKGRNVVLSARCSHLGADLSKGCVIGDRITCPLHGWEYGPDGACEHIPATSEIPDFARQRSFPIEERGGHVFFFNRPQARFALPFFEGLDASQLLAARCFEFIVDAPWYIVSANAFDAQHYHCAHDRVLAGDLLVDCPDPFSRRLRADFAVTGTSFQDRVTRRLSGASVNMTVTTWCGNLILVKAKFRRTTTYGVLNFVPLEGGRTWLRDIVWIRRKAGFVGHLIDKVDAEIRRYFIREFVRSDVDRSHGIRFNQNRVIPADKELVEYLNWLQPIHR